MLHKLKISLVKIKSEMIEEDLNEINDDIEELKYMIDNNKKRRIDVQQHLLTISKRRE